jgi:succinate dehydrogenase/fumarate reductase flavoprotein subunit
MTKSKDENFSRREFLTKTAAAGVTAAALAPRQAAAQEARVWDRTADFVSIGAGVSGLSAAVSALEHGASVILVDENFDIGGHGMVSGGIVHLGGGTSMQRKHGIEDSTEKVYEDWIRPDHPLARYNDRDLVRAFADENASTFEWLVANGVDFEDEMVGPQMASTVPRQVPTKQWPIKSEIYTSRASRRGSGLVRALEKRARENGAEILLRHHMTSIIRENPSTGRVLGIRVTHEGRTLNIRALKGVLIATGGHTNNINLRRVFDPRLTEEYAVAGDPYSRQSGDGEIAAMALGASLWGTAAQTNEAERVLQKAVHIGAKYGYRSLHWPADSPIFDKIGGEGLTDVDWANAILVTQEGERFYDETANTYDFLAAAMASRGGDPAKRNGGGPIWAIFDHDAVERQGWNPTPPYVDPNGYFFSANTIGDLASRIENEFQPKPMAPAALEATVARYNAFADAGADVDFGKPMPLHKIQTPPFYAAWSTPLIHDSYTGLRTNASTQVIDLHGEVIPGLYCAGESQGGFNQHGLGRSVVFGRIAGRHAALSS